jgi:hypothetical protein
VPEEFPGRCSTPAREALSFDAVAIRVNSRLTWNFSVEESGRREAEVYSSDHRR